ncbi:glycoside hydrolase family 13 protein [uncultured Pseudokineococcus sp.]|uniref:glycoside hydrolase family 13 protein n=1 Tax=uncultured Pseudokineococcus sp. TaxID=1642928 RepID=UPI0026146E2E|nr:glycoside hydrolase family 13 protein [uncultured Pseudokineococcus sp.]
MSGTSGHLLGEPHHDGSALMTGTSAPELGERVPVRVLVPDAADGSAWGGQVHVRQLRDGEPALRAAEPDGRGPGGTWFRVEVEARNPVTSYRFLLSGRDAAGRPAHRWLTGEGTSARDVTDAADFRLLASPGPAEWVADQVAYQVFPDRFARSGTPRATPSWADAAAWDDAVVHRGPGTPRQWFGGDLDGVAAHLDHVQSLGASLLYLTPFFEARSNHRYDAVTFDRVDPVLGGDEAMGRLVAAAHARGMRVMGDLTTNHTGVEHPWFRAAAADRSSEEAGYYRFLDDDPIGYETWLGVDTLPKLDHTSAALRARLVDGPGSVVAEHLRRGLDGWRIDVANMTGRLGADDLAVEVARLARATAHAVSPGAWMLAEHCHDASADLVGDGWHGAMDYAGFTRPVWAWLNGGYPGGPGEEHGLSFLGWPVPVPVQPGGDVVATMRAVHAAMPWRSWAASTSHLDTHDTPRFRTVTGGGRTGLADLAGRGRDRAVVGVALQMTLPGVPTLFAGDEAGFTGLDGEHSRTPMPWDRPGAWDAPTLDAVRTWGRLRRDCVALRRGGLRWVAARDDVLVHLREHADQRVLVHTARADHAAVRLPLAALGLRSAAQLVPLVGEALPVERDGVVELPSHGPSASAWALEG